MPIPPISISAFGGEIPGIDDRLLPDNAAAEAVNSWLFSGRIEPVHSLQALHVMSNPAARSFFRIPQGAASIDFMVNSYWMEFENPEVRVIRSPTAGQDDMGRYYWADGVLPKMTTGDRVVAGDPPLTLGIPTPAAAPGVTASGGVSTTNKTVSYVYTWVSSLGEEGPPSPATTVTNKIDAIYHITLTAPTGTDTTDRDLTLTRIYRTVVSGQGIASFYFVVELPIVTLAYDDDCSVNTDAVIVNNEQLPSLLWSGPPADLQGLVSMANGMVAGWRKNEVWFCEPYRPHAWPIIYVIAVDATIVGLGVFNQSLIILTDGQPYAATGVQPGAMSLSKIQPLEACTSMRSIVNTPNGVLFSSPNGLINVTPAGAVNLTIQSITKDRWAELLHLDSVMASVIAQGYYSYSGSLPGVFQTDAFQTDAFQQESNFGTKRGVYISLNDERKGVVELDPVPSEVMNVITDVFNGETMVLRDGTVYLIDLRKQVPSASYRWRSKIFTLPYLQNLGAAKVYWTPAFDPAPGPSYFRVYAGDHAQATQGGLPQRFQQEMETPGQMFRLPSGFKAQYYQFEVEGYVIVDAIHATQTPHELRQI